PPSASTGRTVPSEKTREPEPNENLTKSPSNSLRKIRSSRSSSPVASLSPA
ncbi:hypothetical protein LEMLEM_LOCUS17494, partial [Lemmus lemmus]